MLCVSLLSLFYLRSMGLFSFYVSLSCPDLPGFKRGAHGVQPSLASFLCEFLFFFGFCLLHGRFSSLF